MKMEVIIDGTSYLSSSEDMDIEAFVNKFAKRLETTSYLKIYLTGGRVMVLGVDAVKKAVFIVHKE